MPTGISETDVHQAADALVAQGERPTIERIRAHLGTGSPNTVTRWLETWWQRLDERLRAGASGLAAGNPPADVAALAQQWWEVAVTHAHTVASQALGDAHAALQARTDTLTRSEAQIASERLAWAAERTELIHARDLAQRGVKDLEAHLLALGRHLDELQRQHAQVDTEREGLLGQLLAAQAAAQDATAAANAARTEREQAHRAAEDRWLQEVDRARQEAARHAAIIVQRDKAIERMTIAQADLQERLRVASVATAAAEARANTLQAVRASQPKARVVRKPKPTAATAAVRNAKRK
ncbi:DNA-binding protein [Pseudoxanthomonas sp. PXM01]|uniref:DNA-binding protein n=1 Tax=Pseudoxanthomonas sp. PXM01 TaxID=2769295 RepID=UPI00177CAAFA|nr:DNA-binding protein [Pseudoxanthomonas sp. PXM01]MBD9467769.1 DNA-binding protein [Pseudoxanthomonas sp. PXM01]